MQKNKTIPILTIICLFICLLALPLVAGAAKQNSEKNLSVNKTVYAPGEEIHLTFQADGNWARNAWIGIIPSNIQHGSEAINDEYDITYQYIENRTQGEMVFTAPGPGKWDLRMHDTDDDGREIAYISFTVE